jgi:hypothetical protein
VSNLENRYRRLLRVLPAWYRAEREEEMVGLFLADRTDELDLEHSWPGWGETGATLALAVRTRFAASGAPAQAVALGDVVRLVALIGVLVQGAYAIQGLISLIPLVVVPEGLVTALPPVTLTALVSNTALLLAPLAMVTGFRGVAKALFTLLSVGSLAQVHGPGSLLLQGLLWQVPLWLTTLALFAGFHRDAPTPALGRWRWALAATVLGTAAVHGASVLLVLLHSYWLHALAPIAVVPAAAVVAGVVHLVRHGSAVRALALSGWTAALLPVELVHLPYTGLGIRVLVAATVAVGAALLVVGLRDLRRPAPAVTP